MPWGQKIRGLRLYQDRHCGQNKGLLIVFGFEYRKIYIIYIFLLTI